MSKKIINIDEPTTPRFEFRTFGYDFTDYNKKMAKLSLPVPDDIRVRTFDEIYVISKTIDDTNIKVKNDLLDIKKLIQVRDNLEQWNTIMKYDFPISKKLLMDEIFPALGADISIFRNDELNKKQFIMTVKRHKDLLAVPVQKQRHAYIINLTICEFAEVVIGNNYLYTVSVESTEAQEVIKTIQELNLDSFENINYIQAIKRVNDIISKPLAN
ncbi:hypothetical protein KKF86_00565 [bacterium]|nr:hypothetical protein [bacterium]